MGNGKSPKSGQTDSFTLMGTLLFHSAVSQHVPTLWELWKAALLKPSPFGLYSYANFLAGRGEKHLLKRLLAWSDMLSSPVSVRSMCSVCLEEDKSTATGMSECSFILM